MRKPIGSLAVIESFYKLRAEHGGPAAPALRRATPKKMIADALAYASWCAEKGVDPIAFMRGRFTHVAERSGRWPSIRALKSETALAAWEQWREGESLQERASERLHAESRGDCTDPRLAQRVRHYAVITPPLVQLRRRYRAEAREHVCEQDRHFTGGYDPRDSACRTCPRKASCLALLNQEAGFDVGALRAGVLGALPTQVRLAIATLDTENRARLAHFAA